MEGEQRLTVPHTVLSTGPSVLDARDASNRSSRSGAALDPAESISLSWRAVDGVSAYQILIYRAGEIIMVASSAEPVYALPASSLPAASLVSASVSAQWLSGDPLYETAQYCSMSSADGPSFSFSTR
jgi:hypothetical protein